MTDEHVINLADDPATIDRPTRLRPGVRVLRPARITAKTITSPSPCCGNDARIPLDDAAWLAGALAQGRNLSDSFRRTCRGCGWPYELRMAGETTRPRAIEWTVQAAQ